jgi:hypothetical protein
MEKLVILSFTLFSLPASGSGGPGGTTTFECLLSPLAKFRDFGGLADAAGPVAARIEIEDGPSGWVNANPVIAYRQSTSGDKITQLNDCMPLSQVNLDSNLPPGAIESSTGPAELVCGVMRRKGQTYLSPNGKGWLGVVRKRLGQATFSLIKFKRANGKHGFEPSFQADGLCAVKANR